jgi:uridylate kinase
MPRPRFNRILLKLSGEALMGDGQFGIDPDTVARLADEIRAAREDGHELCIVVGGGNIFRGLAGAAKGFDRASADYMGMLATVMNALAMQNALEKIGVDTRVQSAIPDGDRLRALYPPPRHSPHGEGQGGDLRRRHRQSLLHHRHRAALRAAEMGCDALFKGTSVDGVYDADPKKVKDARRYESVTFNQVLSTISR